MHRVTPTSLAEAAYQATLGRRYRDINGIPDPRRAWKPQADPPLLAAIARAAFAAHVEELMPAAGHPAIAQILDQDLASRFFDDDMTVLDRWGFARQVDAAIVEVGGPRVMHFMLPRPRTITDGLVGRSGNCFTALPDSHTRYAPIPEQLRPAFEPVVDAQRQRVAEFDLSGIGSRLQHELKRRPIWAEIEAAYPRIGAWMAKTRSGA